jgi:hypothetical protein
VSTPPAPPRSFLPQYLACFYGLAIVFNQVGLLWACGVAMRFRSVQAGPLMQTPVFMALFLAPVYVPLELLRGWIHAVARLNPLRFQRKPTADFDETIDKMLASAKRFDSAKIRADQVARSGGPPAAEE